MSVKLVEQLKIVWRVNYLKGFDNRENPTQNRFSVDITKAFPPPNLRHGCIQAPKLIDRKSKFRSNRLKRARTSERDEYVGVDQKGARPPAH